MGEMAQKKAIEAPDEELEDLIDELEPGTKLLKGQYTIVSYLNSGGFGITYLAKDSLDRNVVIKECFPSSFCRRSKAMVSARSRAHTAELRSVVQLFVREARSLAKIVHPNIVAVHQVFEDNGTAYMAIDYIDGLDLQQIIDGQGNMPTPDQIVELTDKLLHAVGFIHANDMLHRDISPDNILVDKKGEPILIDFGAAREQASQTNRAMSALRVVKDGYSPQEFYIAGSEQGPWSDLYALGASLYHLISGDAPVNGQARLAALAEDRTDPYQPLDGRFPGYPPGFLKAIDTALRTLPKQRLQSADQWLAMFRSPAVELQAPQDPIEVAVHELVQNAQAKSGTAVATAAVATPAPKVEFRDRVSERVAVAAAPAEGRRNIGMVQVVAGVAVALAVVGVGIGMLGGGDRPAPAVPRNPIETAAPAAAVEPPAVVETAAVPAEEPATVATVAPEETPATGEATAVAVPTETAAVAAVEVAPAVEAPEEAVVEAPVAEPEEAAVEVAAAEPEETAVEVAAAETAVPVAPVTELGEAEAALLEEASRLSASEAVIMEDLLTVDAFRLPFASPIGTLLENQTSFVVWDVEMPFSDAPKVVGEKRIAVVSAIESDAKIAEAGNWIKPGVLLYAVNGVPVSNSGDMAGAVLNALRVDPDGKARVVVDYSPTASVERQTGLLTVKAVRLVSLANGTSFAITNIDGAWKTVVTQIGDKDESNLRLGDVLFREKTTQTLLDRSDSLEKLVQTLVQNDTRVTSFTVLRDNKVVVAAMRLAVARVK